jgi:hypothetical protein
MPDFLAAKRTGLVLVLFLKEVLQMFGGVPSGPRGFLG